MPTSGTRLLNDREHNSNSNSNSMDQLSSLGSESILDGPSSNRSGYESYQAHQRDLYNSFGGRNGVSFRSSTSLSQRSNSFGGGATFISGLTEEFTTGVVGGNSMELTGVSGLYEKSAEISAMQEHNIGPNDDDDNDIYGIDQDDVDGEDQASPLSSSRNFSTSGSGGGSSNKIMSAIAPRSSIHFSAKPSQRGPQSKSLLEHSVTINRLRLDKIGFYGREDATMQWKQLLTTIGPPDRKDDETKEGEQAPEVHATCTEVHNDDDNNNTTVLNRTKNKPKAKRQQRHLVLLSGPSGSGKSRLLEEWTKTSSTKNSPNNQQLLCVGGKFDQSHNLPYSGIALACEKFLAALFAIQVASNVPTVEEEYEKEGPLKRTRGWMPTEEAQHMRISTMAQHTHQSTTGTNSTIIYQNGDKKSEDESTSTLASGSSGGLPRLNVSYEQICTRLQETLEKEESKLLVEFIPMLSSMLTHNSTTIEAEEDDAKRAKNTRTTTNQSGDTDLFAKKSLQFQHAFKKFVRTLSEMISETTTSSSPSWSLVLTLDDLQWSDTPSLELIKSIVTDHENTSGLIVVGCYRSDEVDDEFVRDLQDTQNYGADSVTTLAIDNLSVKHVTSMIADILSIDVSAEQSRRLAELVHTKTLGNPLFVIQYMKLLVDVELVKFDNGVFEWNWDIDRIDKMTMATANVVDIMLQAMKRLPDAITRILPLIGSLGFSFTKHIFEKVVVHFNRLLFRSGKDETREENFPPDKVATTCIRGGLIEEYGAEGYRWRHDKLQEAATSLVEKELLHALQYQLGVLLFDSLTPGELEDVLFVVTNLLNKRGDGSIEASDEKRRLQIAQLNLKAGTKAIESASFVPAAWYLSKGIELLPNDRWENHYELSLELYSAAAQAAYSTGDFKTLKTRCDEVLAQKDRPLLDKQRAYNALLDSIGAQDRMGEAAMMCMEVLAKLGCKFPKRAQALFTIAGLIRTEMTLKKRTPEQISKYETMADPSKIWAMKLLDKLFTFLYQDKSDMVPLAILKSLRWTINYGVCDLSMPNFASVGFMLAAFLGDLKGGRIYGERALELLERSGSEDIKSRTLLVVYGSLLHWTTPFDDCRAPILEGYHIGLKMGDVESALWCILFYLWFSLFLGTPLGSVMEDLQVYAMQMRKFKQKKHESWTLITLQAVLNLIGLRENTNKSRLIGEAISEAKMMEQTDEIHILKPALNLFQMYVMFYFGEHESVVKMIESNEDGYFEKAVPGIAGLVVNAFHSALSCISMARQTGKSKYRKMAKKFTNKIKTWVEKGNPNVIQYKALLESEWSAMRNKKHEAIHNFEVAILMAGRRGLLQDRAVAHERCSDFYMSIGDQKEAAYHAKKAMSMYEEWGGLAVANRFKEKRSVLFELPSEIMVRQPQP